MKVEILTIFFGPQHLDMFHKTLVPSLLPNIRQMTSACVDVVHRIHCPKEEARALAPYKSNAEYCVEILAGTVSPEDHAGLSNPFKESLRREVLTVMAPCDHVFGCGLWPTIKDIKPGQYMVCGHPRIETERGLAAMTELLKKPRNDENRMLVNFCMEQIQHPMVEHGKRTAEPYWFTHRRSDHWETHFAEPPPLAWWGAPYMLNAFSGFILFTDWEVVDHEMVEHCRQANALLWVDDSRKFFWAEFTNHDRYHPTKGGLLQSSWRYECMKQLQQHPLKWYFA